MSKTLDWRKISVASAVALVLVVVIAVGGNVFFGAKPKWIEAADPLPDPSASQAQPYEGWSDPANVGKPYGSKVQGLLTFRGNPTRTFYGTGPVARTAPRQLWRYPKSGDMCAISIDEHGPAQWCGTGWTGQPAVFEREGRTWVVFGAYDKNIHFLDAETGEQLLPDFPTGDIVKGSVTVDPDGYPLIYIGSRDNYFRVIAIDRPKPTELWKLGAYDVSPTLWNNDWDGCAMVIDDYLFEGGENSQFHIAKLNRGYGSDGKVTVAPKLVFHTPGWDDQELKDTGHKTMSIENSVTIVDNVVYFGNSGGLIQGWDISGLKEGVEPKRVFRFWTGDDTDATVVADDEGMLYVGVEFEKANARSKEIGQMIKLNPKKPDNPLVWKVDEQKPVPTGVWGTPALYKDVIMFPVDSGGVVGIDRATGMVRWKVKLPAWVRASPVVVDGVLLIGDCKGDMHAYDATDTSAEPKPLWTKKIGSCIESTPAVWKGRFYVGTRAGAVMSFSGAES